MQRKFSRSFDELKEIVAFTERFFTEAGIDPLFEFGYGLSW